MIPIVDCNWHPDVAISGSAVVHILKCVYVQPEMKASLVAADLEKVREYAVTPGLGGLPQGVVAWCDMSPEAIERLSNTDYVSGLNIRPDSIESLNRCLEAVNSNNLTLDLDLSGLQAAQIEQVAQVAQAVSKYPEVQTVLDLSKLGFKDKTLLKNRYQEIFEHFHSLENVSIKITGIGPVFYSGSSSSSASASASDSSLGSVSDTDSEIETNHLIKSTVNVWGADRVMLASHAVGNASGETFDQLWTRYGQETLYLPARERESLLRSNAIRVYRL